MKSIDVKSLIIGMLGTALVFVLMGRSELQKKYDIECVVEPFEIGDGRVFCKRFDLSDSDPFNRPIIPDIDGGIWQSFPDFYLMSSRDSER